MTDFPDRHDDDRPARADEGHESPATSTEREDTRPFERDVFSAERTDEQGGGEHRPAAAAAEPVADPGEGSAFRRPARRGLLLPVAAVAVVAAILGGAAGVLTFVLLGGGLIAPASPGSIIAYLLVSPPNKIVVNLLGIIVAAIVSFVVGAVLLGFGRREKEEGMSLEEAQEASDKNKGRKTARVGTARA
jgi:hypothetical protein